MNKGIDEALTECNSNEMRPHHREYIEQLEDKKARIENELKEVNDAIRLLKENPKVQSVLDALRKTLNRL